ncbi:MAG TPA: GNAT family N-acetyltransferase [Acidimicrobiales bacterium]
MTSLEVHAGDPGAPDVRAVVERHLAFARSQTPGPYSHAVEPDDLSDPAVTVFCARAHGRLVGIAALRELDPSHGEVKSMHTVEDARGRGVGGAMVAHLLAVARQRGYRRVSLETGTGDAFAPARALYAAVGFEPCSPFGDYDASPFNHFMTMELS